MKNLIAILILVIPVFGVISAQDTVVVRNEHFILLPRKIIDGDTLPHVNLNEVLVINPPKFKNKRDRLRYNRLVINVKKTLPYARTAAARLRMIDRELRKIEGEKARKKYIKQAEKELFNEFEAPLRKLTFSQGKILIKLIDRETGDTSYELIKEYKGGLTAFFWQSVARIFGSNLKDEFDAVDEDRYIEYIVYMIDHDLI